MAGILAALYVTGLTGVIVLAFFYLLHRISRLQGEVKRLSQALDLVETRARVAAKQQRPAPAPAAAPPEVPAPAVPPAVAAPAAPATPPPPAEPAAVERAPQPTVPVPPVPETLPEPTATEAPPQPEPAAARQPVPTPQPAAAPPPRPTPPPRPVTPPPPPPPSEPAFDWESLLGVKGAAWLGGIALFISAILFFKLANDRGLITPAMKFATGVLAGLGALAGAELALRRGYAITANAVSAAGIAVLYAAFFAGHALYGLFGLPVTFTLMVLVTITACVLAIRHDAQFIAVLGLLGGFSTPLALSTGVDRPLGFFSYLLLLDLGLAAIALRRRWHGLVLLSLAGTGLLQLLWFGKHMSPEKVVVALGAFLIFGLFYLAVPLVAARQDGGDDEPPMLAAASVGGLVPFFFGLLLAGSGRYTEHWLLLFGYLALLEGALLAIALFRGGVALLGAGAAATAITLPVWAGQGLSAELLWGPVLGALGLTALSSAGPRLARARGLDAQERAFEVAALIGAFGLAFFTLVLVGKDLGEPPWAFLLLLVALCGLAVERTRDDVAGLRLWGAPALAALVQLWFFASTETESLVRNLAVPQLLTLAFSVLAWQRAAARLRARRPGAAEANLEEAGVVGAGLLAVFGLFACLISSALGSDPRPLLAALAVALVLLITSALRRGWTMLVPLGLAVATVYCTVWHSAWFQAGDAPVAVPAYTLFMLAFAALPFALPRRLAPGWEERTLPWRTAALAPVAFFPLLQKAWRDVWGRDAIGLLPVLLAGLAVLALTGVARRFSASTLEAPARRRLGHLALFAAVALGFVAVAIPLQLEKQWITAGWALEGLALWWLVDRLPHPGLKWFGALLFACVGLRLLANPDVLRYHEHGTPIFNWILYTYGVPAACCLVAAGFLRAAAEAPRPEWQRQWLGLEDSRLPAAASFLGLVLIFALINLEVLDYFSPPGYLRLDAEHGYARDLTMSVAWGVYAMALLAVGVWRAKPSLRYVSLGFLILTVGKVFLWDLSELEGGYRILSFLGLGVALVLVSLFYQRFVFRRPAEQR